MCSFAFYYFVTSNESLIRIVLPEPFIQTEMSLTPIVKSELFKFKCQLPDPYSSVVNVNGRIFELNNPGQPVLPVWVLIACPLVVAQDQILYQKNYLIVST